ncbi:MAG: hypothetical protein U0L47_08030 [Paludibacteraceae bacterium]|nr:hypothetical protein [Paludibacteraceae bacterium]
MKVSDWNAVRNELQKHVSRITITNWKNGLFEASSDYWSAINGIAEQFGYDKPYKV